MIFLLMVVRYTGCIEGSLSKESHLFMNQGEPLDFVQAYAVRRLCH